MTDEPTADPVATIEVVCTGNICRSPYAAALLLAAAADRLDDIGQVRIRSSGVSGLEGHPAAEGTVMQAARRGLDLTGHVGARWTEQRIRDADLVLTMSESQRAHISERVSATAAKTFTICELARLANDIDPIQYASSARQRIEQLAAAAHAARPFAKRPRSSEDVADPYGGPPEGYARMAAQLDRLVLGLADQLFGPLPDVDEQLFGGPQ